MFSFEPSFISQLVKKEKQAFTTFYLQTVDHFFRYLRSTYTLQSQTIEDLVSSFYLKFRDVVVTYDQKYPFESYVWLIFKNLVKDHFKKEGETYFSQYIRDTDEDPMAFEDTLVAPDATADILLQTACEQDFLQEAIDQLDGESRDLLYWRYIEEKPYEEIARLFGTTSDNVRQKISRLTRKLERQLTAKN